MSSAAVVRYASWQHDSAQLMLLREAVFICEQKVPAELEWDELDAKSWHAVAESGCGNPIATGRLTSRKQVGRIAVLPAWRGKGVGGALLDFLLLKAQERESSASIFARANPRLRVLRKAGIRGGGRSFCRSRNYPRQNAPR